MVRTENCRWHGRRWLAARVLGAGLAVVLTAIVALAPGPAGATDWLVLLVDRSNSIDDRELRLQRDAYVRVLTDPEVAAALADTQVALIEFDTRAELVVPWKPAAEVARRYARPRPDGPRGQTAIGAALRRAMALLDGKEGRRVIDVSGDGRENRDMTLLKFVRFRLDQRGVLVNGLVLLNPDEPDLEFFYETEVANGFVMAVEQQDDFFQALKRKLLMEMAVARALPVVEQDAANEP